MYKLTVGEINKAVAGSTGGNKETVIMGVATDSREVREGYLFVAIQGEHFDGHDFINQAVDLGATVLIVSKDVQTEKNVTVIKVSDTVKALGDLAKYTRSMFKKPVIAVTGSVGKSSTVTMIGLALGKDKKVLTPEKNFNNHIGLPKTLINLDDSYDYAVVEMGMSGFGEIAYLSSLAKPDVAVISNIGISHIGKLGSKQNILKAKMEIIQGMNPESGLLLMNGDDGLLKGVKDFLPVKSIYFGTEEGNDYTAFNINKYKSGKPVYQIKMNNRDYEVRLNVPGYHMVYNSLAALAAANELGVSPMSAIEGIGGFTNKSQRMEIIRIGEGIVINDTYNASPESVEAALSVLGDLTDNRRKVVVLGDMLEMGGFSEDAHRQLGSSCVEHGIDLMILLGEQAKFISEGAIRAGMNAGNIYLCDNHQQLNDLLTLLVKSNDAVLVKGSRGMKMEEGVQTI
ncbi:MAG TPA: UDP-N-acetylmuramoyl-tripeptide--D-alanyl-D-alanine ligase, partial [Clostridiales bacterium]|nr:UDP-N-acetylmuramoyl-tripeptide--D-alanyl-D-alanine ligase [Clostridiales bacterium]